MGCRSDDVVVKWSFVYKCDLNLIYNFLHFHINFPTTIWYLVELHRKPSQQLSRDFSQLKHNLHQFRKEPPHNSDIMGAVVSCVEAIFRTIGNCLMTIVNAIGTALKAIINAIVSLFDIIISCLTCGRSGRRRTRMTGGHHRHMTTSRI